MDRRFRKSLAVAALLSASGVAVPVAYAAPKDAAAQKLDKQAMDSDYLNVKFDDAERKLRDALSQCGASGCTPKIKAQIQMHLGIILVNKKDNAGATQAFADGLKIDPTAAPEPDYTSAEVTAAFEAAKGKGSTPAPPPPTDKPPTEPDKPPPDSDFKHEPVTESQVLFPIPIFVAGVGNAARVVLYYKPFGGGDWVKVEMKKMGRGYGAEVPCKDTSTTGTLKYYVEAKDAGGDSTGNAGTKKQPFEVKISNKISGEPPAFPGKDPPNKCKDQAGDCPPGLNEEGCDKPKLAYGAKCTGPGQCNHGDKLACIEGTCQPGEEGDSGSSGSPDEPETGAFKKNWLSFSISGDDAVVNGGDICSDENYRAGTYTCFRQDKNGALYNPGSPDPAAKNFTSKYALRDKGTVSGPPFAFGTIRFLVGYDRVVVQNLAVGARLGFAVNGGPTVPNAASGDKKFLPFHAEVRGTYWIGKNVLSRTGVRPYVFLGGGVAQVDAKIGSVPVSDDCDLTDVTTCPKPRQKITVDAWRKMGTTFVGLGGGVMYAVSKNAGLTIDLKFSTFFGSSGFAISPTIGFMYGL